jgi:hypothetical protein
MDYDEIDAADADDSMERTLRTLSLYLNKQVEDITDEDIQEFELTLKYNQHSDEYNYMVER